MDELISHREGQLTLGSLFSGSGGFELAGCMHGIVPVWSSEIEPFPLRVEALRFPDCKQLGSVTDINGADVEPVDIITFGSPCQDLSVAGKQKGIHDGERSNLFFEAIRIIKEMRNATADKFPRFAVWENVPGAFSSNKGEDFRAVLQALCEIKGGCGISVPMPRNNKWLPAGCVVGDGFSVAWRVYDAQYWGVPQRRKRIYLIADFGSERAGEILFVTQGMSGHSEPGGKERKGTSGNAERGAGGSNQVRCLNPWDNQSIRQYSADGVWPNLNANSNGGQNRSGVCYSAAFMGGQGAKARSIAYCDDGSTPTIKSVPSGGNTVPDVVYPINTMVATRGGKDDMRTCFGVGEPNDPQFTLSAAHEHGVRYAMEGNTVDRDSGKNGKGFCEGVSPTLNTQDRHAVTYAIEGNGTRDSHKGDGYRESDTMYTLNTTEQHAVAYGIDQQGGKSNAGYGVNVSPTLCAISHGTPNAVCFQQNQREEVRDMGEKAGAITAESGMHNQNYVCYPDKARSLCTRHDSSPCVDRGQNVVCNGVGCRNACLNEEKTHTIQAKNEGGYSLNYINPIVYDARGNGNGSVCPTVCSHPKGGIHDYEPICCERVYPVENHPADSRCELNEPDDPCQTLSARMGTGGVTFL